MTAPSSPSVSTPYRNGAFLKESKENVPTDKETISNSESLLEDLRRESGEISQLAEDKMVEEAAQPIEPSKASHR